MYGECEGSQDKKIVMIGVREGPWEGRHGMKGRYKKKSTVKEENHNSQRSPAMHYLVGFLWCVCTHWLTFPYLFHL